MANAMRSFPVTSASRRPLYWALEVFVALDVWKLAMSAMPSNPLPTPGFWALVQPGSCFPSPLVKGEPMSRPWPGMVLQFTPSFRPASPQVEGLMLVLETAAPGNVRYFDAMLPDGAEP